MSSNIPQELYQNVISHLKHDHDTGTRALISTAQCSWALRYEAQRILFRNPFLFIWQSSIKLNSGGLSILQSHEAFLEAILHSPTRLGPLVHSYNQFQISYNKEETALTEFQCDMETRKGQRAHIFELTEKALPCMTNLKSLYFMTPKGLPTSPKILLQCHFQLEVMEWAAPGKRYDIAAQLLPRQKMLTHLNVMSWDARNLDPECISKNLVSLAGTLEDLTALARGRTIEAFQHHEAPRGRSARNTDMSCPHPIEALGTLKFLRVGNYRTYLKLCGASSPGEVFQNLRLLELAFWSLEDISTCTLLPPNLQVLVLQYRLHGLEGNAEDVARSAFKVAPHLQFVEIGDFAYNSNVVVLRYCNRLWGLTDADTDRDTGRAVRVTKETILFGHERGDTWWRERAASLGWIEATEDMTYRHAREYDILTQPTYL